MKRIKKDELYRNLSKFLLTKGVEFTDGSYANRIRQGCSILTDTINFTQANLEWAKNQMDQKLDHMRQVIHEKTSPRAAAPPKAPPKTGAKKSKARPSASPKATRQMGASKSKSSESK